MPAAAIDFEAAGKSLTKLPVRKKVAGTWLFASVARMLGTPSALAPASTVSATTLGAAGMAVQLRPPRPGGAAAEAALTPVAATVPAAAIAAAASSAIRRIGRIPPDLAKPLIAITPSCHSRTPSPCANQAPRKGRRSPRDRY